MSWAGQLANMGEKKNAYSVLMGKPEINILLERPRCRGGDIIKMDLRERKRGMDWFYLAQGRPVERCY
jgi:hypothetical protein